jgi:hypothetical protein
MVIRLLPAPHDSTATSEMPGASSAAAGSGPVAVVTRINTQSGSASAAGAYSGWTQSAKQSRVYTTSDLQNDDATTEYQQPTWSYLSSADWTAPPANSPAAHYLMYSGALTQESGQLVNLYA